MYKRPTSPFVFSSLLEVRTGHDNRTPVTRTDFTMKIFYILCACAVVSAAPNPDVTKEQLHDYPVVRLLLAKQTGPHHVEKRLFGDVFEVVSSAVEDAGSAVGQAATSTADAVGNAANDVAGDVESVANDVSKAVVGGVESVGNDLVDGAKDVVGGVESGVKNLGKAGESVVGGFGGSVENVGQAVTSDSLEEALQNLGEAAESAAGGVEDGAGHFAEAVEDAEGVALRMQNFTKAGKYLVGGATSVCRYLVQKARAGLKEVVNEVKDSAPSVPIEGKAAALAEKHMEKLIASGALGQTTVKRCRAVLLTFVTG
ncbi:hypothetical protein C0Q70_18838 [Pomacea canaliculata]|uniref:Uncharacterized protein n=1 Tax=Pomacea canaliculata TaxID=400727 RepID=A0A2T7NHM9_POMCA|nr:uncharacterized protein LOC112553277 [Pomacea canaliculata]PVD20680.1 hypothetical protein C0Q70_18838 [Pomacea canaliculata]